LTWEQEVQSEGYRVKFLSEPKDPKPGTQVRLVFEVQRKADGVYAGGLTPRLRLTTRGKAVELRAVEADGVIGYYEAKTSFPWNGTLGVSFEAKVKRGKIEGKFRKKRAGNPYATLGKSAVGMVSLLTFFGGLTSIYRRRNV
jgi:hypothetical protein